MELKEWLWQGIRLRVPATWELLLFSKNPRKGSITFADRYQYRLQLAWQKMEGEPDIKRMIRDYTSRLQLENSVPAVRRCDAKGWRGLRHDPVNGHVLRMTRFFRSESLLLEIIEPVADRPCDDFSAEKGAAEIEMVSAADAGLWKAFGITCRVEDGFKLARCEVQPGLAALHFEKPAEKKSGPVRESFYRRGMVRRWLKTGVDEWLAVQPPAQLKTPETTRDTVHGHEVHRLTGTFSEKPSGEWRSRTKRYRATAWVCPADNRLYCRERVSEAKSDTVPEPDASGLQCCPVFKMEDSRYV
jgi:hypothetical protein